MCESRILILGLGSILMQDDGVGVRVVESLQDRYAFSPNIELMDGGTLGITLINPILDTDHLIVVDAVRAGSPPGTIHRLSIEELRTNVKAKQSLHQVDFLETLFYAEILGGLPSVVIIGIEPAEMNSWTMELTETVGTKVGEISRQVLEEVEKLGGSYRSCKGEACGRRDAQPLTIPERRTMPSTRADADVVAS